MFTTAVRHQEHGQDCKVKRGTLEELWGRPGEAVGIGFPDAQMSHPAGIIEVHCTSYRAQTALKFPEVRTPE